MASPIHVLAFTRGDHVCLFYRDLDDWAASAVPYVELGCRRGERCFCVLPPAYADRLLEGLRYHGINVNAAIQRGALVLLPPEQVYLADGGFDPKRMQELLAQSLQETIADGYESFRALGDLGWAARDAGCCAKLPEYERMMEHFYPGRPALGLCTYDMNLFSAEDLRELMKSHRVALSAPDPSRRSVRLRNGQAFGDVIFDNSLPTLFHYAVQSDRSPTLIASGQETTFNAAMSQVKSILFRRAG